MKEVIDLLKKADNFLGKLTKASPDSFKTYICENCGLVKVPIDCIRNALSKLQVPPRYETPEQYKKRTGKEWPRNWAVYYSTKYGGIDDWEVSTYSDILEIIKHSGDDYVCEDIIVATELGRPPDGWTPEDDA
jgi:hypothetical protein